MESEAEALEVLLREKSRVRRQGVLSKEDVAAALTAYYRNACAYLEDVRLLHAAGRSSRAAALCVLALEELAKVPLLANTFMQHVLGWNPRAWEEYWKAGGSHGAKQKAIESYGKIFRAVVDRGPLDAQLFRHYPPEAMFARLDAFKQSNLYVDIREDGVHEPAEGEDACTVLDYLLAFGQERADSYASWHCTSRRSENFLDQYTAKEPMKDWTRHYDRTEIAGDLIYQLSFWSAGLVPDYSTFRSILKAYIKRRPRGFMEDGLVATASMLNTRMAVDLPRIRSRTFAQMKLLSSLAEELPRGMTARLKATLMRPEGAGS